MFYETVLKLNVLKGGGSKLCYHIVSYFQLPQVLYFYYTSRDLGTSLNNLNTLWLSRCCLAELDGISCIGSLKVSHCNAIFLFIYKLW